MVVGGGTTSGLELARVVSNFLLQFEHVFSAD